MMKICLVHTGTTYIFYKSNKVFFIVEEVSSSTIFKTINITEMLSKNYYSYQEVFI